MALIHKEEIDRVSGSSKNTDMLIALEQKALELLKTDQDFNKEVREMVENSKALKDGKSGAQLLGGLKAELEERILQKAHAKLCEILSSPEAGISDRINEHCNQILAELHRSCR